MLKTAKTSEQELIRKRALADKMAKKRARRDAIIANFIVIIPIWLVSVGVRATGNQAGFWGLAALGIVLALGSSYAIKEKSYNKYYRIYLQERRW